MNPRNHLAATVTHHDIELRQLSATSWRLPDGSLVLAGYPRHGYGTAPEFRMLGHDGRTVLLIRDSLRDIVRAWLGEEAA